MSVDGEVRRLKSEADEPGWEVGLGDGLVHLEVSFADCLDVRCGLGLGVHELVDGGEADVSRPSRPSQAVAPSWLRRLAAIKESFDPVGQAAPLAPQVYEEVYFMHFPNGLRCFVLVSGPLVLSACGGGGNESEGETSPDGLSVKGKNPKIVVHDRELAEDMLVGGRLDYLADGDCLTVHADKGGEEVTVSPIWPKNVETASTGDKHGVKVPGFGTLLEGDTIEASGSFWKADDARMKDVEIAAACRPEGGFIVFNADSFKRA